MICLWTADVSRMTSLPHWPQLRCAADSFPQGLEREAHAFEEDFAVELRMSGLALGKDDGKFAEAGSAAMQGELHLHQEGVSLGADVIQVDLAQDLGAVADKSGCHVVYRHSGEDARVKVGSKAQGTTGQAPVPGAAALYIARADHHRARLEHLEHARQQLRRMR